MINSESFEQGFGCGDPDMWDDRELIKSYDKAVRNWRRSQGEQAAATGEETAGPGPWREVTEEVPSSVEVPPLSTAELLEVGSWIIGAPCRALYSEDGLEYEAKILGIAGPKCTVRFVGKYMI